MLFLDHLWLQKTQEKANLLMQILYMYMWSAQALTACISIPNTKKLTHHVHSGIILFINQALDTTSSNNTRGLEIICM